MRRPLQRCLRSATTVGGLTFAAWASAQMHRVDKPETVVRAVGVYEWTGDLAKPAASRLIPVTVFINGELEDGAIYQPQPIPFALTPGNAYELQQAGLPKGLLELHSASKQPDADIGNVDGWWGYGSVEPQAQVTAAKLRASRSLSRVTTSKDDGKPTLTDKSTAAGEAKEDSPHGSGASSADPDRPTLRRRSTTGANQTPATSTPAADPNNTPAEDPDRPTLKRHDPAAASGKQNGTDVTPEREVETGALNNDPNRPTLHRGRPTGAGNADQDAGPDPKRLTKLAGLPEDLHQMVAVSDPANRPEHDFARPWTDDAEHKLVQVSLEATARAQLAAYGANPASSELPRSGRLVGAKDAEGNPMTPTGGPAFAPSGGSASTTPAGSGRASAASPKTSSTRATTPAARRRAAAAAAAAKKKAAADAAAPPLLGEDLRGFTLSYGGAPTFVLTAHTPAANGAFRYVTVVAQQDAFGKLETAFSSVTDSGHLDRTPWMRLVGVVDVEASNRASLLFELREGGARQFALFRVLSGRSEPLFTTGLTQ